MVLDEDDFPTVAGPCPKKRRHPTAAEVLGSVLRKVGEAHPEAISIDCALMGMMQDGLLSADDAMTIAAGAETADALERFMRCMSIRDYCDKSWLQDSCLILRNASRAMFLAGAKPWWPREERGIP